MPLTAERPSAGYRRWAGENLEQECRRAADASPGPRVIRAFPSAQATEAFAGCDLKDSNAGRDGRNKQFAVPQRCPH